MTRRATALAGQLDLLGLDGDCLARAGAAVGADAQALRERWNGDRLPCAGEAQLRCPTCGLSAAVRFRCAGRCEHDCEHGEKAAAALLRVIPRVPVRHWVLTLPGVLRQASAIDQRLVRELSRGFLAEVFALIRERVPGGRAQQIQCGGVSLVHRSARALVLDVHVHALVLDGGYLARPGAREFLPIGEGPTMAELEVLTARLREQLLARWKKRRSTVEGHELWQLAVEQSLVSGPVAATAVRRIRVEGVGPGIQAERAVKTISRRVGSGARRDGFGVHVMERIDASARGSLAALARYLVRAPVALADLRKAEGGRVVQRLPRPFADGSTHVEFSTDELAKRLVALSPARHVHRVSYHGALAPGAAAKWSARPLQLVLVDAVRVAGVSRRGTKRTRSPWQSPECTRCGGRLRVIAVDESVDPAPFRRAAGEVGHG